MKIRDCWLLIFLHLIFICGAAKNRVSQSTSVLGHLTKRQNVSGIHSNTISMHHNETSSRQLNTSYTRSIVKGLGEPLQFDNSSKDTPVTHASLEKNYTSNDHNDKRNESNSSQHKNSSSVQGPDAPFLHSKDSEDFLKVIESGYISSTKGKSDDNLKKDNASESMNKKDDDLNSSHKKDDDSSSSHKKDDDSNSSHKKDDDSNSFHKKDDDSNSSHKKDDDSNSSHKKDDDSNSSHKKDDDSNSSHKKDDDLNSSHNDKVDNLNSLNNTDDSFNKKYGKSFSSPKKENDAEKQDKKNISSKQEDDLSLLKKENESEQIAKAEPSSKKQETESAEAPAEKEGKPFDDQFVAGLTQQIYLDIDGYLTKDLEEASKYPDKPDEENAIQAVNFLPEQFNGMNSFGERIFGYFRPPMTGNYTFKISSNGDSELKLSTNSDKANIRKYADQRKRQVTNPGQYDKFENQKSMPVPMEAGKMYFIEVLHKGLYGKAHVQVGATFPDNSSHTPIEPDYFFSSKEIEKEGDSEAEGTKGNNGNSGGSGGNGGTGAGAGGGAGAGSSNDNPLQAALDAGFKAGQQNGAEAGSEAGENAGKRAGQNAGAKAGAEAGVQAAAAMLGISVEQLKEEKELREANKKCGLKVRLYSANFECSKPGGHVCKHALSAEEDSSIRLNPRESATTFILRKPGLNHKVGSVSFELDAKRSIFLRKDGETVSVAANDGTKGFAALASFSLDSQDEFFPSAYGIRYFDNPDLYVCHRTGVSDVNIDKATPNCVFYITPPELDMNFLQPSCKNYCEEEPKSEDDVEKPKPAKPIIKPQISPAEKKGATIETLHLLDALARHAANIATEKTIQDSVAKEKVSAVAKVQAEQHLKADSHFFDNLHHEFEEGQHLHGEEYVSVHFINKAAPPGTIRIISSIKEEGYLLGADVFKLKIVFKHKHPYVLHFTAIDEKSHQKVLLNGMDQLTVQPSVNPSDYLDVMVTLPDNKFKAIDHLSNTSNPIETSLSAPPSESVAVPPSPVASSMDTSRSSGQSTETQVTPNQKDVLPLPDIVEIAYEDDRGQKKSSESVPESYTTRDSHTTKFSRIPYSQSNVRFQRNTQPPLRRSFHPETSSGDSDASSGSLPTTKHRRTTETMWSAHNGDGSSPTKLPSKLDQVKKNVVDETVFSDVSYDDKLPAVKDSDIDKPLPKNSSEEETFNYRDQNDQALLRDYSLSRDYHVNNSDEADIVEKEAELMESDNENKRTNYPDTSSSDYFQDRKKDFETDYTLSREFHTSHHDDPPDAVENATPSDFKEMDAKRAKLKRVASFNVFNKLEKPHSSFLKNMSTEKPSVESYKDDDHKKSVKKVAPLLDIKKVESNLLSSTTEDVSREESAVNRKSQQKQTDVESHDRPVHREFNRLNRTREIKSAKYDKAERHSERKREPGTSSLKYDVTGPDVSVFRHSKDLFFLAKNNASDLLSRQKLKEVFDLRNSSTRQEDLYAEKSNLKEDPVSSSKKLVLNSEKTVAKSSIMDVLKKLEENSYKAKLKTLNEFLKRYTANDEFQKKRYEAWQNKHRLPVSWYFTTPVTGYKRSPANELRVVHDDVNIARRAHVQLHDDRRQIIPPSVLRQSANGPYHHTYFHIPASHTASINQAPGHMIRPSKPSSVAYAGHNWPQPKFAFGKPETKQIFVKAKEIPPDPVHDSRRSMNKLATKANLFSRGINHASAKRRYLYNYRQAYWKKLQKALQQKKMFIRAHPASYFRSKNYWNKMRLAYQARKKRLIAQRKRTRSRQRRSTISIGKYVNEDEDILNELLDRSNEMESVQNRQQQLVTHEMEDVSVLRHAVNSSVEEPLIVTDNVKYLENSTKDFAFDDSDVETELVVRSRIPKPSSRIDELEAENEMSLERKTDILPVHENNFTVQSVNGQRDAISVRSFEPKVKPMVNVFINQQVNKVVPQGVKSVLKKSPPQFNVKPGIKQKVSQQNKAQEKTLQHLNQLQQQKLLQPAVLRNIHDNVTVVLPRKQPGNAKPLNKSVQLKQWFPKTLQSSPPHKPMYPGPILRPSIKVAVFKYVQKPSVQLVRSFTKQPKNVSLHRNLSQKQPRPPIHSQVTKSIERKPQSVMISALLPAMKMNRFKNHPVTALKKPPPQTRVFPPKRISNNKTPAVNRVFNPRFSKPVNTHNKPLINSKPFKPNVFKTQPPKQPFAVRNPTVVSSAVNKNVLNAAFRGPLQFPLVKSKTNQLPRAPFIMPRTTSPRNQTRSKSINQPRPFAQIQPPLHYQKHNVTFPELNIQPNYQLLARSTPAAKQLTWRERLAKQGVVAAHNMLKIKEQETTARRNLAAKAQQYMLIKQNRFLAAYLAAFYRKNPVYFKRLNDLYYFKTMTPEQYGVYVNKFVEPLNPKLRWRIANYMRAEFFMKNRPKSTQHLVTYSKPPSPPPLPLPPKVRPAPVYQQMQNNYASNPYYSKSLINPYAYQTYSYPGAYQSPYKNQYVNGFRAIPVAPLKRRHSVSKQQNQARARIPSASPRRYISPVKIVVDDTIVNKKQTVTFKSPMGFKKSLSALRRTDVTRHNVTTRKDVYNETLVPQQPITMTASKRTPEALNFEIRKFFEKISTGIRKNITTEITNQVERNVRRRFNDTVEHPLNVLSHFNHTTMFNRSIFEMNDMDTVKIENATKLDFAVESNNTTGAKRKKGKKANSLTHKKLVNETVVSNSSGSLLASRSLSNATTVRSKTSVIAKSFGADFENQSLSGIEKVFDAAHSLIFSGRADKIRNQTADTPTVSGDGEVKDGNSERSNLLEDFHKDIANKEKNKKASALALAKLEIETEYLNKTLKSRKNASAINQSASGFAKTPLSNMIVKDTSKNAEKSKAVPDDGKDIDQDDGNVKTANHTAMPTTNKSLNAGKDSSEEEDNEKINEGKNENSQKEQETKVKQKSVKKVVKQKQKEMKKVNQLKDESVFNDDENQFVGKPDDQAADLDRLLKSYDSDYNHDVTEGDWFDSTFQPDATTKQDLKITKSGFLHNIFSKQKHKRLPSLPARLNEGKVDNIVKMAESREQRELQNLIKESIGHGGMSDEIGPPVGLSPSDKAALENNVFKNESEPSVEVETETAERSKGIGSTNSYLSKVIGDFKNDFALGEKDSNGGLFDDAVEKGDVMSQIKDQDQKEVHDLKLDLAEVSNPKSYQYNESMLSEKSQKTKNAEKINLAFDKEALNDESGGVAKNTLPTVEQKYLRKLLAPTEIQVEKQKSKGNSVDILSETPVTFRKHNQKKTEQVQLDELRRKWRNVRKQNKMITEDEEDEMLALAEKKKKKQRQHSEDDDSNDHEKKVDLLNSYFNELDRAKINEQDNSNKDLRQRQAKRQHKIKATLAMINDIEKQIDNIINVTEKSRKKTKVKRKGKAAIFNELTGGKIQPTEVDSVTTPRVNRPNRPHTTKISKKLTKSRPDKYSTSLFDDQAENDEEELEDGEDEWEDSNEDDLQKYAHPSANVFIPKEEIKPKVDDNIDSVIASKDRKERMQQAEALYRIQKDEVNADLLKLKEVTQDGLQSMFAKAVAKQQKFMDDIQGPGDSYGPLETRDVMPEGPDNKLLSMAPTVFDPPLDSSSMMYNLPAEVYSPVAFEQDDEELAQRKDHVAYEDDITDEDDDEDYENQKRSLVTPRINLTAYN